jgi:hypothetical protein
MEPSDFDGPAHEIESGDRMDHRRVWPRPAAAAMIVVRLRDELIKRAFCEPGGA